MTHDQQPDVEALRHEVHSNPSRRAALANDSALLARLAHLSAPPASTSSHSDMPLQSCLSASWLSCALGAPPSAGHPRGSYTRASLSSMLAARLGRGRRPEDGVRILSLDGGGTRALVTIEMLKELEAQTGQRVHELFDVIAGTSTGGILAAGIQERLTLVELEELYLELATQIFTREAAPRRGFQLLLTGATYKAAKLEAILKRVLPRLSPAQEVAAALAFMPDSNADASTRAGGASGQPSGEASSRNTDERLSMLERRALQEAVYAAERASLGARPASPSPPRYKPEGSVGADSGASSEGSEEIARGWSDPPAPPTPPSRPPHLLIVACLTSRAPPVPYIFRNYE